MRGRLLVGLMLLSTMIIMPAFASDATKTYQVMARAVGFTEGAVGTILIGVLFDPAVAESVATKDAIMALDNGVLRVGQVILKASPIEVSQLAEARDLGAVFLGPNLYRQYAARVKNYVNDKKIPSLGADVECVWDGLCVVGVDVRPSVQVYVNTRAADAARVSFQSAFRMMIKEI